ncbi:MAG: glycosyltransferase family 39 protein [Candidatus Omnitrophica bacterium]|nr:glycosyltransferase family 39 protein [Candidatus Omnitrophota bacterium]
MMNFKNDFLFLSFIVLVLIGIMVRISGDYGISRDEPDYYFVGERDFHFILSGNPKLLEYYEGSYPFEVQDHPHFRTRHFMHQPAPLAYMLSAASCNLFYRGLGWFTPLEAHRLVSKVLVLALIAGMFYVTKSLWGRKAAALSVLFLIFFPRFFGEIFMNTKDIPNVVFFSLSLMAFWKGVETRRADWIIFSSLFFGFALATKINAFFIPAVLLAWLFLGFGIRGTAVSSLIVGGLCMFGLLGVKALFWFGKDWPVRLNRGVVTFGEMMEKRLYPFVDHLMGKEFFLLLTLFGSVFLTGLFLLGRKSRFTSVRGEMSKRKAFYVALFLFPLIGAFTLFALYPLLWFDSFHRFLVYLYIYFYSARGTVDLPTGQSVIGSFPPWDGLRYLLLASPLPALFFAFLGLFVAGRSREANKRKFGLLISLWFAIPVARASLPVMFNEGLRHFLEFVPPMAILAGVGAAQGMEWLLKKARVNIKTVRTGLWTLFSGILYLPILISMIRLHPYEYLYFNSLTGGLKGAQARNDLHYASDYWGLSYKEGIEWLNLHAASDAVVVAPLYDHLFKLYPLRQDLQLIGNVRYKQEIGSIQSLFRMAKKSPVYVVYVTRRENYKSPRYSPELFEYFEKAPPFYAVVREGTPLLKIFKM